MAQIKAAVKVNSEQLLFNWQLGRDLVIRRAEEKWGKGVVEQVSLDMQTAFPGVKGFSTTNLWYMKKWYLFYTGSTEHITLIGDLLNQIEIDREKLHQLGGDMRSWQSAICMTHCHSPFRKENWRNTGIAPYLPSR